MQASGREREGTENRGQWAPVSSIRSMASSLSLYCVASGQARAASTGPGLSCLAGDEAGPLSLLSTIGLLSTHCPPMGWPAPCGPVPPALAQPAPATVTPAPGPGL